MGEIELVRSHRSALSGRGKVLRLFKASVSHLAETWSVFKDQFWRAVRAPWNFVVQQNVKGMFLAALMLLAAAAVSVGLNQPDSAKQTILDAGKGILATSAIYVLFVAINLVLVPLRTIAELRAKRRALRDRLKTFKGRVIQTGTGWSLETQSEEKSVMFICSKQHGGLFGPMVVTWTVTDPDKRQYTFSRYINYLPVPALGQSAFKSLLLCAFPSEFIDPAASYEMKRGEFRVRCEVRMDLYGPQTILIDEKITPLFPIGLDLRIFSDIPSSDESGSTWAAAKTVKKAKTKEANTDAQDLIHQFSVGLRSRDGKTYRNTSVSIIAVEPAIPGLETRKELACSFGDGVVSPGEKPTAVFDLIEDTPLYGNTFAMYKDGAKEIEIAGDVEITLLARADEAEPVSLVVRLRRIGYILSYTLPSRDTKERWPE